MRILIAFRAFFRTLTQPAFAEQVAALTRKSLPAPGTGQPRSEAIALLAVLQREGRLTDFLQEPIDEYTDAQVGAAVRDLHRGCRKALARMFDLKPALPDAEGGSIEIPAGFDPARIALSGHVVGDPPWRGTLQHAGWEATRCDLPEWTGSTEAAMVVAPAEVEVR